MQLKVEESMEEGGSGIAEFDGGDEDAGELEGRKVKFLGKKKRKSGQKSRFLQKAKKSAKKGHLGRGFEIETETYNYFLHVMELLHKNEFEMEEDRDIFIENTFRQTENCQVNLSSNQMTSRVLESILPLASEETLLKFAEAFTPSLRTICADPFASHVLEKLLEVTSADKWTKSKEVKDWFRNTSKYVLNNFEDFTFDPYANHVMRKVCNCLSGFVLPSGQHQINPNPKAHPNSEVKKSLFDSASAAIYGERKKNKKNYEVLKDFFGRFISWPQFYDLFQSELTCGFVQILLKTVHRIDPELIQNGVAKTISALGDKVDFEKVNRTNFQTRTIEACLGVVDETGWIQIYKTYFQGNLALFGTNEKGKFSLKRLIETCPKKEKFEAIFNELQGSFSQLYKADHTSPFVTVAEGCKKFQTKQAPFVQAISALLGYDSEGKDENKNENIILCLARFGKDLKAKLKEDGTPLFMTDISGTLVLQEILEFHKPHKIINAMLELEGHELSKLAQDPKGSHIVDSFFKTSTIGDKNKEKLFSILKDYFIPLALTKFGSRVLQIIWSWANIKLKEVMASELSTRVLQLNANVYGKYISANFELHSYKKDPKQWAQAIIKGRKAKLSSEVEEEGDIKITKKKKRKSVKVEAEEVEESPEVPQEQEESPKKLKKRKNKPAPAEAEESVKVEEDEERTEEPVVKKSKKKKKKHSESHE